MVLWEGSDIVTRETCVPTYLNVNNLGKAAALHLRLVLCQTQTADYWVQLCLHQILPGFS
jgi:hypothetical protein